MIDKPPPNIPFYEIRLKGHLESRWGNQFVGMVITLDDNGETLLTGPVPDQAALHGLLKKVRDVGLPLLSINSIEPDTKEINRKTLQKFGGFAALYLAVAYLIGIVLFLVVLDYPSITDPAQKVALLSRNRWSSFQPTCSCTCSLAFF